jgi:predicted transposase YdaD
MEIGEKKGIEIGKEEGMLIKNREIALKMLLNNVDIDFIENITGLSKEEIENLNKLI